MNTEQARFNMIEQQVRPWDVLNPRVLETIEHTHREHFVPEAYQGLAYADSSIPLAQKQFMLPPVVIGRILQALDINENDNILEIGTGSGYLTACLAQLGAHVSTTDIHQELLDQAQKNCKAFDNISYHQGDFSASWHENDRFDAIVVTGSLPHMNENFQHNLEIGGRLFIVTGQPPIMQAHLITRTAEREWNDQRLFETSIPALVNHQKDRTLSL
ncbi:MAG: protein-L-isoaspartate O-methyltransferase [Gammaproteobacteria bacterium]|nr:protein-L-isoaspartate O-methyltransferase [Gammaproteobacteria bacterium]